MRITLISLNNMYVTYLNIMNIVFDLTTLARPRSYRMTIREEGLIVKDQVYYDDIEKRKSVFFVIVKILKG